MILDVVLYVMNSWVVPGVVCAGNLNYGIDPFILPMGYTLSICRSNGEFFNEMLKNVEYVVKYLVFHTFEIRDNDKNILSSYSVSSTHYSHERTRVLKYSWKGYEFVLKRRIFDNNILRLRNFLPTDIKHKNIVKVYRFETSIDKNVYYAIMDYLPIKLNEEYFVKNKVEKVLKIAIDVTRALIYMHHNKILHNDITVDNVMGIPENGQTVYKLIDHGCCSVIRNKSYDEKFYGSKHYMAPETKFEKKLTKKTDVWQVGMLIYRLMARYYNIPHYLRVQETTEEAENAEIYLSNIKKKYKECELSSLLDKLLILDPDKRPDANEMLLILEVELSKHYEKVTNK